MEWRVVGERTVYESPWVALRVVDVEPPGRPAFPHHVVHVPRDAVGALVTDRERGVLLLWRHRFITDTWGWEIPAGAIEPGEDPAAAAAREVLEETGWRPGPMRHQVTYNVANGITDHRFHIYLAEGAERIGDPVDDIEAERVEWVGRARLPGLVTGGGVPDGPTLTALLWLLGSDRIR